ncbi:hypothetical protein F4604DRAFT_1686148 [Suillus subluteus]|nr:hypothetical protein F4604DRAFT_1686148 [Suillus subluteus]
MYFAASLFVTETLLRISRCSSSSLVMRVVRFRWTIAMVAVRRVSAAEGLVMREMLLMEIAEQGYSSLMGIRLCYLKVPKSGEALGLAPLKKRHRSRRSYEIPRPCQDGQDFGSDESAHEFRKTIESLLERVKCLEEARIREREELTTVMELDEEFMYHMALIDQLYDEIKPLQMEMGRQRMKIEQLMERGAQEESAKQKCIQAMRDGIKILENA